MIRLQSNTLIRLQSKVRLSGVCSSGEAVLSCLWEGPWVKVRVTICVCVRVRVWSDHLDQEDLVTQKS